MTKRVRGEKFELELLTKFTMDTEPPVKVTIAFWPSTWKGLVGLIALLLAVVAGIWVYGRLSDPARSDLNSLIFFESNPKTGLQKSSEYFHISFWTPNELTHSDLLVAYPDETNSASIDKVPKEYQWQLNATEEKNTDFVEAYSEAIGKLNLGGFRRWEVTGIGSSKVKKRGYWWVATVDASVDPEKFVTAYNEYWEPKSTVYMEIFREPTYLIPKTP